MVVEKHLGPVTLSGELGYGRSFNGDKTTYPSAWDYREARNVLTVGMEIAGEAPADRFSGCELSANVGLKWKSTRHVQIHGLRVAPCARPSPLARRGSCWWRRCTCEAQVNLRAVE